MTSVTVTVASKSDVGRVRKNNEDSFAILNIATGERLGPSTAAGDFELGETGCLLAVSDGMGGHQAGEVASALVLDSLCQAIQSGGDGIPVERVDAAVRSANAAVVTAARTDNKKGMGATLTAVFATGTDAYVAQVGDSRAYLLRAGQFQQLSHDQSLVQMLVDRGALSPDEAKRSPQKNIILQAMGLADEIRVAIGRVRLDRDDTILICCDGLSNAIADDELREILADHTPTDACEKLIELANERGGEDNLTAMVARFGGDGLAEADASGSIASALEVLQDLANPLSAAPEPPGSEIPFAESELSPVAAPSSAASATSPQRQTSARPALIVIVGILILLGVYWWLQS